MARKQLGTIREFRAQSQANEVLSVEVGDGINLQP